MSAKTTKSSMQVAEALGMIAADRVRTGEGAQQPEAPSRTTQSVEQDIETVRRLFGEHPEDLILTMRGAADTFAWLHELFRTIEREAGDVRVDRSRLERLAGMGAYLSFDYEQVVGNEYDRLWDHLEVAGVVPHGNGGES